MQLEATRATHKATTRPAVVPCGVSASGAVLRGMSRVNRNHPTPPFFGFVRDQASELGKRPRVNTPLGFGPLLGLHSLADVGQVLDNHRPARLSDCTICLLSA